MHFDNLPTSFAFYTLQLYFISNIFSSQTNVWIKQFCFELVIFDSILQSLYKAFMHNLYTSLSLLFNFFYTDLCITDCGLVSLLARFSNHYKQAFVRKLSTLLFLFPNSFIQTLRHKLVYASFFGLIPFASCKGIQSC